MSFKKSVVSGVRVLSESHHLGRAVSLGFFLDHGSRHEKSGEKGLSHFLEHLAFKGTKKRSALEIAKSLESLGGDLNAYTSKENTVFHALVLRDHWKVALDVLSDLFFQMQISEKDFAVERSVILQEMAMSEDQHEDLIYDLYFEECISGGLSTPILGTVDSLNSMNLAFVRKRYRELYNPRKLIVSVAGPLEHAQLVDEISKRIHAKPKSAANKTQPEPKHRVVRKCFQRDIEQTHILLGFQAPSFQDEMRFDAFIANALLGGGMTSRLYQAVREKKGLAYSISSHLQTFTDFGLIMIQASSEPKHVSKILTSILQQFEKLQVTEKELESFKTQVKGSLLLGADDVENRMTSLAVNELVFGEYRSVERVISEIDAVSLESLSKFLKRFVRPEKMSAIVYGAQADRFQKQIEVWGH